MTRRARVSSCAGEVFGAFAVHIVPENRVLAAADARAFA